MMEGEQLPLSSVRAVGLCFPLSRVKKIMKTDKEVSACHSEAVISMTAAAVATIGGRPTSPCRKFF